MLPLTIQEEDGGRMVVYGFCRNRSTRHTEISYSKLCTYILIFYIFFGLAIAIFNWFALISHCIDKTDHVAHNVKVASTTAHPQSLPHLPDSTHFENSTPSDEKESTSPVSTVSIPDNNVHLTPSPPAPIENYTQWNDTLDITIRPSQLSHLCRQAPGDHGVHSALLDNMWYKAGKLVTDKSCYVCSYIPHAVGADRLTFPREVPLPMPSTPVPLPCTKTNPGHCG